MQDLIKLIMKLSWNSSIEQKENAIERLMLIEDKDLHILLQPMGKEYWEGAAEVITRIGYPRINNILPGLLEWVQDLNWPGAMQIADLLSSIGEPIVPHVKKVLKQHMNDEIWIGWLFSLFINGWETERISQIKDELIEISKGKINDIRAINTLFKHKIIEQVEVKSQLSEKYQKICNEIAELDSEYSGIDCNELERGFREVIFKPELSRKYFEDYKEQFSYCNYKSYLKEYLSEVEELSKEVWNSA